MKVKEFIKTDLFYTTGLVVMIMRWWDDKINWYKRMAIQWVKHW